MRTLFNGRFLDVSFEEDLAQPDWNDALAVSIWFMKACSRLDPQLLPEVEDKGIGDPTFDANRFAADSRRANDLAARLLAERNKK